MANPQAYIHDGYTRDCYVEGIDRLYPAVRFTFRPYTVQERDVILKENDKLDSVPRQKAALQAKVIVAAVKAWDITRPDGDDTAPVELTPEEGRRIQPLLFNRLWTIVLGYDGGDDDPKNESADRTEKTERDLDAALAGTDPDTDAKNSETG